MMGGCLQENWILRLFRLKGISRPYIVYGFLYELEPLKIPLELLSARCVVSNYPLYKSSGTEKLHDTKAMQNTVVPGRCNVHSNGFDTIQKLGRCFHAEPEDGSPTGNQYSTRVFIRPVTDIGLAGVVTIIFSEILICRWHNFHNRVLLP